MCTSIKARREGGKVLKGSDMKLTFSIPNDQSVGN